MLAAVVGGVFALLVGVPLMRLSGLAAGIATFAVLGVTYNILNNWTKIGPGFVLNWLAPKTPCTPSDSLLNAAHSPRMRGDPSWEALARARDRPDHTTSKLCGRDQRALEKGEAPWPRK